MRRIIIGITIAVCSLGLTVCGCDDEAFRASQTEMHDVTGPVTVAGTMRDATGTSLGPLEIVGADGIRVLLLSALGLEGVVLSDSGSYTFTVEPGKYSVGSTVNTVDLVSGPSFTVSDSDIVVTDTLRVTSQGDATVFPNPHYPTVTIKVNHLSLGTLAVTILGVDQSIVRRLTNSIQGPGVYTLVWDGKNEADQEVPDGAYWALITSSDILHHQLMVRDSSGP